MDKVIICLFCAEVVTINIYKDRVVAEIIRRINRRRNSDFKRRQESTQRVK